MKEPANNITAAELFERVAYIARQAGNPTPVLNRMMHQTLALACHEGIRQTRQAFGNLFSQVDYLCRHHRIPLAHAIDIQRMRRDSNRRDSLSPEDLRYDCRALAIFISALSGCDVPSELTPLLPHNERPREAAHHIDYRSLRCIVRDFNNTHITATTGQESKPETFLIDYTADHLRYLKSLLSPSQQLQLIDVSLEPSDGAAPNTQQEHTKENAVLVPSLIVLEPDYLVDISAIARCFTDYGHHPLSFTLNNMAPAPNSQAILLGNFAGNALDDIINNPTDYDWRHTFKENFKDKALEYCTCEDLNRREPFHAAAVRQTENIRQIVAELFGPAPSSGPEGMFRRDRAILEPSFICPQLGLQGRVDLMTTDFQLLVEQKSGGNWNIECGRPNEYGSYQKEEHYVQLLLYYGVLRQNFQTTPQQTAIRLLYSKYPLPGGLVVVNFYRALFREAIKFRNQVVCNEFDFALHDFDRAIDALIPDTLNARGLHNNYYNQWIQPRLQALTAPLHDLSPLERSYFSRMATFAFREQLAGKVGAQEGVSHCTADLWSLPLAEKRDAGDILTSLHIIYKEKSSTFNGYDTLTLSIPHQGEDFLPNFRAGDPVYLYAYDEKREPDASRALLFKGRLVKVQTNRLIVHLNDGQQNPALFDEDKPWCIEHGSSDGTAAAGLRSLHQFISCRKAFRDLLLGQRAPMSDAAVGLSQSYDPALDDLLLHAKQAQDYYLLVGPPGTGKTSRALQFLVREHLQSPSTTLSPALLLMSYTNRAVDEICGMLEDNGLEYLRIGNEYTCDERYRHRLMSHVFETTPYLNDIRRQLNDCHIIVGTTSTLQSRDYLFRLKRFTLAVIDEASQILEPNLIGLLALLNTHGGHSDGRCPFILIGDHKQLPAVVQQEIHESAVNDPALLAIELDNCRHSLFERLLRLERRSGRKTFTGILNRQGRMHPDLAAFPNRLFYRRERIEPIPLSHQQETSLGYTLPAQDALDEALQQHRLLFFPSQFCREPDLSDKVNIHEAHIVATLLSRIRRFYGPLFDAHKTVGVIVPYRNQIAMIRKAIEQQGLTGLDAVSIDTVERYQGSQRDVIIYSFTVQQRYQIEFLTSNCFEEDGHIIDRKLNVAITRARRQMLITGNPEILCYNRIFTELMKEAANFDLQHLTHLVR